MSRGGNLVVSRGGNLVRKDKGVQRDLFGNIVHITNVNNVKTYRMVKCGICGNSVKLSQSKTHISYGNVLTICNECLKLLDGVKKKRDAGRLKRLGD